MGRAHNGGVRRHDVPVGRLGCWLMCVSGRVLLQGGMDAVMAEAVCVCM